MKTKPANQRVAYVGFESHAPDRILVAGKFTIPFREPPAPAPAVVICHGSDGVDGRGEFHASALVAAGIATLEIDMWAARGVVRGPGARPASPLDTIPDAFSALGFLAAQPEIDRDRIGILGFSWGGAVSLLSAVEARSRNLRGAGPGFAAHAALYPVCWAYLRAPGLALTGLSGAPMLIQTAEADAYDPPDAPKALMDSLRRSGEEQIDWISHPGATHGFDRRLPTQMIVDPFSHGGAGGEVQMAYHARAATAARTANVAFFRRVFGV